VPVELSVKIESNKLESNTNSPTKTDGQSLKKARAPRKRDKKAAENSGVKRGPGRPKRATELKTQLSESITSTM